MSNGAVEAGWRFIELPIKGFSTLSLEDRSVATNGSNEDREAELDGCVEGNVVTPASGTRAAGRRPRGGRMKSDLGLVVVSSRDLPFCARPSYRP